MTCVQTVRYFSIVSAGCAASRSDPLAAPAQPPAAKLIIEVDGDTHIDQARDDRRSVQLARQGFRVIRFSNLGVMTNVEGVRRAVGAALAAGSVRTGEREQ